MSAFDIAGAVVWTAMAVMGFHLKSKTNWVRDAEFWGVVAIASIGLAVFCIVRLFGAHL